MTQTIPATPFVSITTVQDSITTLLKDTAFRIYNLERELAAYDAGSRARLLNDAERNIHLSHLRRAKYKADQFERMLDDLKQLEAD